jgi:hypothetical protein
MERFDHQPQDLLGSSEARVRAHEIILQTALDYADRGLPRLLLAHWDEVEEMGESTVPITAESVLVGVLAKKRVEPVTSDAHWMGTAHGRSWYFDRSMQLFYVDSSDLVSKPCLADPRRFVETENPFGHHIDFQTGLAPQFEYAGAAWRWLDEWHGASSEDVRAALEDYYKRLLKGQLRKD